MTVLLLVLVLGGAGPAAAAQALGGDFTLTDQDGASWSLDQARGKVVLLAFGYTSCPDVCPTTLVTFHQVLQRLGEQADGVQALFVSVDSERDTAAVLKRYVRLFDPRIIGLTGTPAQLRALTRHYGTFFRIAEHQTGSAYVVDHSASLYLIDRGGRLVRMLAYGTPLAEVTEAVRQLLPGRNEVSEANDHP